jgi:hypothetical protein
MLQLLLLPISLFVLFKVFAPVGDPLAGASVTIRYGIAGFSAILAGISFSAASAMDSSREADIRSGYSMAGEAFLAGALLAVLASIFKFSLELFFEMVELREHLWPLTPWTLPIILVWMLYGSSDFVCSSLTLLYCHVGIHHLARTLFRIFD